MGGLQRNDKFIRRYNMLKKIIIKSICIFSLLLVFTVNSWSQEPIKIGGLFAVTGPPSFLGEPERNTANMMVAASRGGS
jgi:branched-chain amino acid transport system substrate-binding protein